MPKDASLFCCDLPGYGQSPSPGAWSFDGIMEPIEAAFRAQFDRPVAVVGFCSGAAFACALAARFPERVERLVLIDPFAYAPWYFRLFLKGEFGRRAYMSTFNSPLGKRITNWVLRKRQRSDEDFTQAFGKLNHEVVLNYLRALASIDARVLAGGLRLPVVLTRGENTFGAVRKSILILSELWPQARVETLRNVGHLPLVKGRRQIQSILFGNKE
jgi:pimeloyl-ACP methyl ester carboxylesterase